MFKLYFTTLIFSIAVYIGNAKITYTQNVFGFIVSVKLQLHFPNKVIPLKKIFDFTDRFSSTTPKTKKIQT